MFVGVLVGAKMVGVDLINAPALLWFSFQIINDTIARLNDSKAMVLGLFSQLDEGNPHVAHFRKAAFVHRDNCDLILYHK